MVVNYNKVCSDHIARRQKPPPPPSNMTPDRVQLCKEFIKSGDASTAAMEHTDERKINARYSMRASQEKTGKSTLFVTHAMDTKFSFQLVMLYQHTPNGPWEEKVLYCPSVEAIERMKSRYPGLEAHSYEMWSHEFLIDGLLAFDMKEQRPYKGGGIVLFVRRIEDLTDEQGKGTNHGHMNLTLYGHNRFRMRMQQPGAAAALAAFIDFVICSSIPWSTIGYDVANTCTDCGAQLVMDEEELVEARKVKNKKLVEDPQILRCDTCDTLVGAKTKCRQAVVKQLQDLLFTGDLDDPAVVRNL